MLLYQACFETLIFLLLLLFFKGMYFNKYGQGDTNKDDLSDYDKNTPENENCSFKELITDDTPFNRMSSQPTPQRNKLDKIINI